MDEPRLRIEAKIKGSFLELYLLGVNENGSEWEISSSLLSLVALKTAIERVTAP